MWIKFYMDWTLSCRASPSEHWFRACPALRPEVTLGCRSPGEIRKFHVACPLHLQIPVMEMLLEASSWNAHTDWANASIGPRVNGIRHNEKKYWWRRVHLGPVATKPHGIGAATSRIRGVAYLGGSCRRSAHSIKRSRRKFQAGRSCRWSGRTRHVGNVLGRRHA